MQLHWNDKVYELFQEIDNNKNIKKSRLGFIDDTLNYLIIE